MSLIGLADFGAPVGGEAVLSPVLPGATYWALPVALDLVAAGDGAPGLRLDIGRPSSPNAPGGWSILSLTAGLFYDFTAALVAARNVDPSAVVLPVGCLDGMLELTWESGLGGGVERIPFRGGPADGRLAVSVQRDQAEALAAALIAMCAGQSATAPFACRAVVRFAGVGARFPAAVGIDLADLWDVLDQAWPQGSGTDAALRQVVAERLGTSTLQVQPPPAVDAVPDVVSALVDRVTAALCVLDVDDDFEASPQWRLAPRPLPGPTDWNLAEAVAASRLRVIALLGNAVAAALVGADPQQVVRRAALPDVGSGVVMVTVADRLPRPLAGAADIGVLLDAPADPPWQPQAIRHLVSVVGDPDIIPVALPLADSATPISATPYAVLEDDLGAHRLEGEAQPVAAQWIELTGSMLPLRVAHFAATPSVLAFGRVEVAVSRTPWTPVTVVLDVDNPQAAVLAPDGASATWVLRAADGTSTVLVAASAPLGSGTLDAAALPGFGPQQVPVSVGFPATATVATLQLTPEAAQNDPTRLVSVTLTAESPSALAHYASTSPFFPGFCWRWAADQGWSDPLPPGTALELVAPDPLPGGLGAAHLARAKA